MYKSLDIITAKVTQAERQMTPHHMLDIVDPLTNFTVTDFRDKALPIVILISFLSLFFFLRYQNGRLLRDGDNDYYARSL